MLHSNVQYCTPKKRFARVCMTGGPKCRSAIGPRSYAFATLSPKWYSTVPQKHIIVAYVSPEVLSCAQSGSVCVIIAVFK